MKNAALLAILALACALTACNKNLRVDDNTDVIDEYETPTVDREAMPTGDFTAKSVMSAVADAGGLTQLPKGLANSVIDNYLMRLGDVTAAANIIPDLKLIKQEINSGIIDRGEVGRALIRLGQETRLIAADDSGYQSMGAALKASGEQLVGENPAPDVDRG